MKRSATHTLIPFSCVLAAILVMGCSPSSAPAAWRASAVRYATLDDFPVWALVAGADTARTMDIAMMFWVLERGERTVLVDAGFYRETFVESWNLSGFETPARALQRAGIDPADVTDVVVTHVHWDHLDGADLFPNADVWIQREELEYYLGSDGRSLHADLDSLDATMLAALDEAGRLHPVEGDAVELFPGVTAYTGGKHTYASQYVGVELEGGTAVLASDNVYLYENLEKGVPIQQTLDPASNLAAQERMRGIATEPRLIVPGHDPAVFDRFPAVGQGVVRIE